MICKYCGNKLSGNICPSCNKMANFSYTSNELADILGEKINVTPGLNDIQLKTAYNSGFSEGRKQGYAEGYDIAKTETTNVIKRQQRFFIIAAACGAVVLALLSSIVTGVIRYNNGKLTGKQEQQVADESMIAESFQQCYDSGYGDGYNVGYQDGYDQGLVVTPTPSPTPTPTSTPTPEPKPTPTPNPFMLRTKSQGVEVKQLQERLITLGYLAENEADGDFGPKTENAVKQFQTNSGEKATGIVGQELWDLIMSEDAIAATAVIQSTTPEPTVHLPETTAPESDADDEP